MIKCRWCADYIINGLPCIGSHNHEPWPELHYVERPSSVIGTTRMQLVAS